MLLSQPGGPIHGAQKEVAGTAASVKKCALSSCLKHS